MKDGGPAFPESPQMLFDENDRLTGIKLGVGGMTIRDKFAAAALEGMLCSTMPAKYWLPDFPPEGITKLNMARAAYSWADAMIAAREKGE